MQISSSVTKLTSFNVIRSSSGQHQWRQNLNQIFVRSSYPNLSVLNSQNLPLNQSVAAIVFEGGSDSELYPLIKQRSKGAIPIAANYRLIDAVISNCINSDITKIYAITQFNSTSLNSHLSRAYSGFGLEREKFVEVIAAYQSLENQGWFQGNADAIRRCLWVFEEFPVTEFLVLPGHHFYKMDYKTLIEDHRRSRADITIVGLSSVTDHDSGIGFMEVDSTNLVTRFTMKPEKKDLASVEKRTTATRTSDGTSSCSVPSTGIYVIGREQMVRLLRECLLEAKDLASEIIPGAISEGMKVKAHMFDGYWEDVKSVGAYYKANMESIKRCRLGVEFYDRQYPLYTMPRCLPPSSMSEAIITKSIIGDGCILDRCVIRGSVIGMRTRIANEVVVEDSVIIGSDIYEMERSDVIRTGREKKVEIQIGIGEKSRIRRAIVDKNARIGKKVMIVNIDNVEEGNREAEGYVIRDGIIVILRNAVIPDNSIL